MFKKQYEKAIAEAERALALDPNAGWCLFTVGDGAADGGQAAGSHRAVRKGDPSQPYGAFPLFQALRHTLIAT